MARIHGSSWKCLMIISKKVTSSGTLAEGAAGGTSATPIWAIVLGTD